MIDVEEGGWIIPHFILTMGVLRFPPDSRGMCMEMLYSVDLDIPMKMVLGFLIFLRFLRFLRLRIDNQNSMGYTLSKIKDKETP